MASHPDYPRTRLFVEAPLQTGAAVTLTGDPHHYLMHVLRKKAGDTLALFNGRDGEWRGTISTSGKKEVGVTVDALLRPQRASPDVWLAFAPIKQGSIDLLAQKATELGVAKLITVFTQHTAVTRVNLNRLRQNAIEAAEQCERLDVPEVRECKSLQHLLSEWDPERRLLYGDESGASPAMREAMGALKEDRFAILTGPEGGFACEEFALLAQQPYAQGVSMGPRILRADTAAIAALAVLQSWKGDWDDKPAFRA